VSILRKKAKLRAGSDYKVHIICIKNVTATGVCQWIEDAGLCETEILLYKKMLCVWLQMA